MPDAGGPVGPIYHARCYFSVGIVGIHWPCGVMDWPGEPVACHRNFAAGGEVGFHGVPSAAGRDSDSRSLVGGCRRVVSKWHNAGMAARQRGLFCAVLGDRYRDDRCLGPTAVPAIGAGGGARKPRNHCRCGRKTKLQTIGRRLVRGCCRWFQATRSWNLRCKNCV